MTFPWKKMKSTRLSQLVNDHLHQSQRRRDGSSLVVETGFPTSLVDLFMKNREKLRQKSKKKRQQSRPVTPLCDVIDDPVMEESPAPPPSPLPPLSSSNSGSSLPCNFVNEIHDVVGSIDKSGHAVDVNGVLFVILKMFLVVILALGTERLTIGITVSAFSLFFLENAGKHVCRLLKLCSETKLVLMLQSVWRLLRFKEDDMDVKNCGTLMPEMKKDESLKDDNSSIRQLQHQEPKIYLLTRVEEIQSENEMIDCSNFIESLETKETELKRVIMEKEGSIYEVAELKTKKSKKAKIKSKIQKFVPKNLRRSRKEQGPERLEIIRTNDVSLSEEQELDQSELLDSSSGSSYNSSGRYNKEDCISPSPAQSEVDEKSATKRGQNWIYLVLSLIVLIGLIRGRVFALMLTLSWCFMLKIGERVQNYTKLPRFDGKKSC